MRANLNHADERARTDGARLVMIGILPTLMPRHVRIDAMSANPRYALLNDQIFAARGEDIALTVDGVERLSTYADSITPEAACTSFQLHLQVSPAQFAQYWNAAQAIAGVQLALAANSPFLFGKELWRETRIPLFEQATDTRPDELKEQGVRPRVWFGERWITSVFDLFEENARYFPALLPICDDDDPVAEHDRGEVPALAELSLHNGTVYRWNRPIYAVVDGRPHLRVENRVLPAGPTVVDAVANAAFYYGLVRTLAEQERPIWSQMSFHAAEENLHSGARHGLDAMLYWPGLGEVPAAELVLRRLLPLAHAGLDALGRRPGRARPAARRHRGALHDRVTGAGWQVGVVHDLQQAGADRRGGPARHAGALPPAHAQQRTRAHLGALSWPSAVVVDGHRVGDRERLAGEDETRRRPRRPPGRSCGASSTSPVGDPGPAGAAHPALARERQVAAHLLGGVEHGSARGSVSVVVRPFEDDRHLAARALRHLGVGAVHLGRRLVDVEQLPVHPRRRDPAFEQHRDRGLGVMPSGPQSHHSSTSATSTSASSRMRASRSASRRPDEDLGLHGLPGQHVHQVQPRAVGVLEVGELLGEHHGVGAAVAVEQGDPGVGVGGEHARGDGQHRA